MPVDVHPATKGTNAIMFQLVEFRQREMGAKPIFELLVALFMASVEVGNKPINSEPSHRNFVFLAAQFCKMFPNALLG
jgi:hypothetical protein